MDHANGMSIWTHLLIMPTECAHPILRSICIELDAYALKNTYVNLWEWQEITGCKNRMESANGKM